MPLRDTLEELMSDHRHRRFPSLTTRDVSLPRLPGKADVVVGMRRSGKTYLLFQEIERLKTQGVLRERTVFISFEDERLQPISAADLHLIQDVFYAGNPSLRNQECWFFLDEIQNVPGWERFVRRLIETENTRVVLTGSSAKLLSSEIATSLRGRSLSTELLPFSFAEALTHAGIARPKRWPPPAAERSVLEHQLKLFMKRGGFPEVQDLKDEHRIRVLQEYVDVVLYRDVIERHHVTNTPALRHLVRRLVRSPASLYTVHKIHAEMKAQGIAIGKSDLHEYVGHLQDAFLLFSVTIDAQSERRRLINPRKAYLVDHALAHALAMSRSEDVGHHLENIVYLEMRRRGFEVHYGVTRSGGEIDFVLRGPTHSLVQVSASLSDPDTRRRELAALEEGMEEHDLAEATIVTMNETEKISAGKRQINVVPAWRWLLQTN